MKRLIILLVFACLFSGSIWAEHEANHRYNIRGYLLDADQQGTAGIAVQAFSGSELLATTQSDAEGYFSLHLHLHNTDNRKVLLLRAGQLEKEIRVVFDPGDVTTARVFDANFVDGQFVEGNLGRFRIPVWVYPLAAIVAIILIAVVLETRRKRKIRMRKKKAAEQQGHSSHKNRARKKKH